MQACEAAEAVWLVLKELAKPPPPPPEPEPETEPEEKPEPDDPDDSEDEGEGEEDDAGTEDDGEEPEGEDGGAADPDDGESEKPEEGGADDEGDDTESGEDDDAEDDDGGKPGDDEEDGEPKDAPGGDDPDDGEGEEAPEDDGAGESEGEPEPDEGAGGEDAPDSDEGEEGDEGEDVGSASGGTDDAEEDDGEDGDPDETDDEAIAREIAGDVLTGDFTEIKSDAEIVSDERAMAAGPVYTVHPLAAREDTVTQYTPAQRAKMRPQLAVLQAMAGPAAKKLSSYMRGAVAASRQSLLVGGVDDGDSLDDDALASIAARERRRDVFASTFRRVEESTYVCVLVDCSGSMQTNEAKGVKTGGPVPSASTCATFAAMTALALHSAMRDLRVPHSVLGFTSGRCSSKDAPNPPRGKYLTWSRLSHGQDIREFVPSPGLHDDGAALMEVTGFAQNFDGEAVLWAARYAAAHGGTYDRVIIMVISDGLPEGADDGAIEGPYLGECVERVARSGIEVYGVGTMIRDMRRFRQYYPDRKPEPGRAPTGCIEIKQATGLADGVLREMTAMLSRGVGTTRKGGR
jgi:cobalamin biosynthesis protein CobT